MRSLGAAIATSFGDAEGGGDHPGEPDAGSCPKFRPALLPQATCPGVGPEVEIRRREGSNVCPPQPPACCEAARRAEAAAKMVSDAIESHPFLRLMQFGSAKAAAKQAALPALLAFAPSPTVLPLSQACRVAGVRARRGHRRGVAGGFL
ncbi:unnamed protein product [Prorocentrum cordatum]|uniref:Uncharacterized protein n=1 Tax=Prorocentrum cordatum TaxID=2364126 RepID=A0ABN9PFF5_9DINO|nr:unnamed protein product [Polarella glacialis]